MTKPAIPSAFDDTYIRVSIERVIDGIPTSSTYYTVPYRGTWYSAEDVLWKVIKAEEGIEHLKKTGISRSNERFNAETKKDSLDPSYGEAEDKED